MSATSDFVVALLAPTPSWFRWAACIGVSAELFFPSRGDESRSAKAVCAECPVCSECLEFALTTGEKFGIWGGASERERRVMRRNISPGRDAVGRESVRGECQALDLVMAARQHHRGRAGRGARRERPLGARPSSRHCVTVGSSGSPASKSARRPRGARSTACWPGGPRCSSTTRTTRRLWPSTPGPSPCPPRPAGSTTPGVRAVGNPGR